MGENAIRKKADELLKNESQMGKMKEHLRAQCTHTNHGEPAFIPSNEPRQQGELKYICKNCKKLLTVTAIDENELQNAINLIDRTIDIIKITAGTINNDDDAKIMEKMVKLQFQVRNVLMPTYRAAIKKGNRNNRRHNNDNENTGWTKPSVR